MNKITSILSTILLVMVILNMTPTLVKTFKSQYEDIFAIKTKVGLLKIKDAITDVSTYAKNIKNFFEKDDIKAILLHIESPGGTSGSSKALFNEIMSLKKDHPKPVVVLTNDLCASGAYYIACAGDYFVASPAAIIGSIGSYVGAFKFKDLLENLKIKYNVKQSGKYKTSLNPFTDVTQDMNDHLQNVSDDVYDQFKADVAARRKLPLTHCDQWANGRIFTGKQALKMGLIDQVGSEYDAIKKVRELAMIEKDKKIEWVKPDKQSTLSQLLGNEDDSDDKISISFIDLIVDKICAKLGIQTESKVVL